MDCEERGARYDILRGQHKECVELMRRAHGSERDKWARQLAVYAEAVAAREGDMKETQKARDALAKQTMELEDLNSELA